MQKGLTIGELIVASSIAIIVIGGAFTLWFMTHDTWTNERIKSEILQELQTSIERIEREMKISAAEKMFFHVSGSIYDAISLPFALDDGRSNTGYSATQDGDGFIEMDSSTTDPITGVAKIYWDQTIIYHVYNNAGRDELRKTVFYPRDNSLTAAERQDQIDKVVSLGTGRDPSVPNFGNWQNTRTIFKANSISLEVSPKLYEFDGYSATIEKTESLIDFGSAVLNGGYHTLKFKVTGKNSNSTGYALGIDSLKFTPPGSVREGENYKDLAHPDGSPGIYNSSGDAITTVNMHESEYGLWSADYYLDYNADGAGDYLTLRFHYDRWYETTFTDGVSDNVIVEFSNTNGRGGASGKEEYLVHLEGNEKTWDSATQAQNNTPASLTLPIGGGDTTYRNLIISSYSTTNGMKLSVKFRAGTSAPLTIQSAYIVQRSESDTAAPDDGSTNMPSIPITFNNCNLDPRNQGQISSQGQPILPPTTTTGNDVTIPAEGYAWSNWAQLYDSSGVNFKFDKTKEYFISFYIPALETASASMSYWEDQSTTPKTHSYTRTDINPSTATITPPQPGIAKWDDVAIWGGVGTANISIYGIEQIDVTYVDTGSFISQVFDTGVDDPAYGTMNWTSIVNSPDATLQMRIRTSDDMAVLEDDVDWSSVPGSILSSSPAVLGNIGTGRYVQFRADLAALASSMDSSHITNDTDDIYPGDEDYDLSCILKDVSIYWPGNTTMVDIGGHFTEEPNYGIFTIEIDDQKLTKGFVVKLSIVEDLTTGATMTRTIAREVEPRNTNK